MNSFTIAQDPHVTKRCPHCDTALEFEPVAGGRLVFTAHDEQFCHDATRERVKMLESVLLAQREAYERAFECQRRWMDKVLADAGLPSLAELGDLKREMSGRLHELNGLGVPPDLHAVWDAFGRAPAPVVVRIGRAEPATAIGRAPVASFAGRVGDPTVPPEAGTVLATHGTAIPPDATADNMLPCPFCRSTMLSVGRPPGGAFPILDRPYVSCTACGARGPLARSDANREAIANWNRRPQDRPHGERCLATVVRSLVVELGLTPSGTGSEDLGIIELEVKRLRAAAPLVDEQRALAGGPAPGTFVRVTAGEHAGFRGTVQPKAADDPPGWCRVQRYLSTETRLFEAKSLDPIESFEERELGDVSDAVRHAEIRKLAAAAGLGEWWVQDMIDAGCTVEQARSHIWTGCGRR